MSLAIALAWGGAHLGLGVGSALAQEGGAAHGLGVGATRTLAGVSAGTVVYDTSTFHVGGLLGFASQSRDPGEDLTVFVLGGQFLYHMHQTVRSDFSIGGGLSVVSFDGAGDGATNVDLEGLAQIRVFLVPNVALSASLGLLIAIGDDAAGTFIGDGGIVFTGDAETTIAVGGQVTGAFGLTYFFK